MAGVATAHSSDALTSADHSQWEFSVPIGNEVRLAWIIEQMVLKIETRKQF